MRVYNFTVVRVLGAVLFIFSASASHGCPVCDSAIGEAVRSGIFNDSFLLTFLEVLAPFPVLGLALYGLNRCLPH